MAGLRYFTDDQQMQESGGRQFDKSGQPLVGHYPDGSVPVVSKRAYGKGQIQIATAKATAAKHGIPFDESKLLNDGDYNLRLSDLHMQDLTEHYGGDRVLAKAAYHQGQGTVDNAVSTYGRADFARGIGPEGRKYIGLGGGGVADVTQTKPGANEVRGMNLDSLPIADPFSMGPTISGQVEENQVRTSRADSVLQNAIETLHQINPQREAALKTAVAAKTEINAGLREQTQQLIERAKPLFQRREAIAHRTSELANMNPIARLIHGTFDPNYNGTDLRARDLAAKNELEVLGSDYDYIDKLQNGLTKLIDSDLNNQDSIWKLQTDNASQDVQLAFQAAQSSGAVLSSSMQGLESQVSLIRAQQVAKKNTLDSLTIGQINAGLDQAKNSENGYATINGIPISMGDLKQAQFGYEEQAFNAESRKMALDSGRIEMADKFESRMIDHMTPKQLEETIAAGGSYNGQQLSTAKLTQALGQRRAQDADTVDNIAAASAAGQGRALIMGTAAAVQGTNQRMIGLFGKLPEQQNQLLTHTTVEMQQYAAGQEAANKAGVGKEYAAANLPKIQNILVAQDKIVTDVAKNWSGGDKDLYSVAVSWMKGQPISGQSATRGMIRMARSGMPAGTHLSGPALDAFRKVQALVRVEDAPKANQDINELMTAGKGPTKEEKENLLMQKVQATIGDVYNTRLTNEVISATPQIAKMVSVNGRAHPFTAVSSADFAESIAHGDQEGIARVAARHKMKTEDLATALSLGRSGPLGAQADSIGNEVTAEQTQATMAALDASPSARPGFKPSKAWADLVNQPAYQDAVSKISSNSRNQSFGDYMTSTIAGPGFNDQFLSYAQGVRQGYMVRQRSLVNERSRQAESMTGDPFTRANMVLSAIDNVSPDDAKKLMTAIRPMVSRSLDQAENETWRYGNSTEAAAAIEGAGNNAFENIHNIINNHKFQDPQLEAIRRRAASQWAPTVGLVDRIISGLGMGK